MKDIFYKILVGFGIIICLFAIFVMVYGSQQCAERGGRYMKPMLGIYECVVP